MLDRSSVGEAFWTKMIKYESSELTSCDLLVEGLVFVDWIKHNVADQYCLLGMELVICIAQVSSNLKLLLLGHSSYGLVKACD